MNTALRNKNNRILTLITLCGAIVLALILTVSSIVLQRRSQHAADTAAHNVSTFYQNELTRHREQIVFTKLMTSFKQIESAVQLLPEQAKLSPTALRTYLHEIKTLYAVEQFAFVDDKSRIYREHVTEPVQEPYEFLNEPTDSYSIRTIKPADSPYKVILVVPVSNLTFFGNSIKKCFMEIDIKNMISEIALQVTENEDTFCNLYFYNGDTLTDIILGGVSENKNLFTALEDAKFSDGTSLDVIKHDFEQGLSRQLSFSYKGIQEVLYYVPIKDTQWMLTYLIQASVIQEEIKSVSHSIFRQNILQISTIVCIMALIVLLLLWQTRQTTRVMAENLTLTEHHNRRIKASYDDLNKALDAIAVKSLATIRINLNTGLIERAVGSDLYTSDKADASFAELLASRTASLPLESDRKFYVEQFSPENLKTQFAAGTSPKSMTVFTHRQSGKQCFTKYSAVLSKNPETDDLILLYTENEYNQEKVTEVLNNKVLAKQYDMVCYIVNGTYGVVIGNAENITKGSIFPKERNGNYFDYIQNQVIPASSEKDHNRAELLADLSTERIEQELDRHESYTVDVACNIESQIFYKRFVFYRIDKETKFYILLKSDVTDVILEQLKQKQLLQEALTEARYANNAKTTFLSNMSHDIRTPMNAIIGFTKLAMKNPQDVAKTEEYLNKIQVSSNHLLSLINDVLEMSRIESGKIEIEESPCSLPEILHDLNTIIVSQVESKNQELYMDALNVTDENIWCDRLRLNQVLLNLLSNAIKYTPAGGKISVRIIQNNTEHTPLGCGSYEIHVKDNGIGMSAEFAEKVFDAFERERNSTVSGIQGTGLGMAITKKIVDLMGGEITVNTELNKGTEFIVKVDFKIQKGEVQDRHIAELDGIRALVIDDNFETCDSTVKMLTQMGLRAEWTLSGKEAVLRAKQAKEMQDSYGVFIIDWRLTDTNGIEVARQIRSTLGTDAAILLMTAYDWPAIKTEAEEAGVNTFCNKPLFMSELYNSLQHALGSSAKQDEANSAEQEQTVSFEGKRVLLVDDMDINREIAAAVLEMHKFIVDQASDGEEAVEKVKAVPAGYYDVVLMDIQMPKMNGHQATKAIRALEDKEKAAVPIVAMTANAFNEDRKEAIESGMNAHIAKPIDEEKLVTVLRFILQDTGGVQMTGDFTVD